MASCTARKNKAGDIISYQIKVSRGRDKLTGKPLTPYTMTYTPPEGWSKRAIERELRRVMGEFEAACKRGEVMTKDQQKAQAERAKHVQARAMTFSEYIAVFLREKEVSYTPGTLVNYKVALTRAARVLGDTAMENITFLALKQYFEALQRDGHSAQSGKPLAYRTVLKDYTVLHSFFANAVENQVISVSPMQGMKRPRPNKGERQKEPVSFTESEVAYILQCLEKEPLKWRALVMFALDSGCRRGEIVGLKWSDIDFETGKVNICHNAQYTAGKGTYITTPKNGKNREIYINRPVLDVLYQWKVQQALCLAGKGIRPTGYCFTGPDGNMMRPQTPTDYLASFGKRYGIPGLHPHALRHTMATISIANGADVVSICCKLGHSTPSITLDVYSHANEEAQRRANEALSKAIYHKKQAVGK